MNKTVCLFLLLTTGCTIGAAQMAREFTLTHSAYDCPHDPVYTKYYQYHSCGICQERFKNKMLLIKHMQIHYPKSSPTSTEPKDDFKTLSESIKLQRTQFVQALAVARTTATQQ